VGAKSYIRSLFRDTRGQAWARTDRGLRSLDRGQLAGTPTPDAVDTPCSSGAVLGLSDLAPTTPNIWRILAAAAPPPDPAALPRPFCAARGTLWTASADGALTARRGERTVATFRSPLPAAPARPVIDTIFEDALGAMWAGGTAGLWRVRDERLDQIGEREGLPAQRVLAITQSLDGDLWLAVDRGTRYPGRRAALIRLNPSDVDRATASRAALAGYRIYDASNGLAGVPLGAAAAARAGDGSLWFSIGGSLTVVDPARVPRNLGRAAPARIAGVTIDENVVVAASAGMLPPGTRKIQIDYTALRLTAPRQD